jgi:CRP/FNR family transcriptional regulator, nitrogen oxide reductase regulator
MANGEKLDALLRADLFKGLDEPEVAQIVGAASRQLLPNGGHLVKQGDAPDYLYLLERGRIRMTVVTPDGSQLTVRMMGSGDVVGCVAVFRGIPYPATATAVAATTVLSWTSTQINDLIRANPQLASNALAIVGGRADELLQRLRETTTEKVEQRIARALIRMMPLETLGGTGHIVILVSRTELADFTGATLYTVSRTISAWRRQGIVLGGRGRITIVDRRRLSMIAGTDR